MGTSYFCTFSRIRLCFSNWDIFNYMNIPAAGTAGGNTARKVINNNYIKNNNSLYTIAGR